MTQRFPLYDTLADKCKSQMISVDEHYLSRLRPILSALSPEHNEEISLILIHHYLLSGNKSIDRYNLPYGMRLNTTSTGLSFDTKMIPSELLSILGVYCGVNA